MLEALDEPDAPDAPDAPEAPDALDDELDDVSLEGDEPAEDDAGDAVEALGVFEPDCWPPHAASVVAVISATAAGPMRAFFMTFPFAEPVCVLDSDASPPIQVPYSRHPFTAWGGARHPGPVVEHVEG